MVCRVIVLVSGVKRPRRAGSGGHAKALGELVAPTEAGRMGVNVMHGCSGCGLKAISIFRSQRVFQTYVFAPGGTGGEIYGLLCGKAEIVRSHIAGQARVVLIGMERERGVLVVTIGEGRGNSVC